MMRVDWFWRLVRQATSSQKNLISPRFYLASAVRSSGKSTCLDVFNKASYLPISALRATAVAMIRILDERFGTLLLDEVDNVNFYQTGGLVAMLNSFPSKIIVRLW